MWPNLARMAFDLLAIPAMSSECERVFSSVVKLTTVESSRLSGDLLWHQECLKNWSRRGLIDIARFRHAVQLDLSDTEWRYTLVYFWSVNWSVHQLKSVSSVPERKSFSRRFPSTDNWLTYLLDRLPAPYQCWIVDLTAKSPKCDFRTLLIPPTK